MGTDTGPGTGSGCSNFWRYVRSFVLARGQRGVCVMFTYATRFSRGGHQSGVHPGANL